MFAESIEVCLQLIHIIKRICEIVVIFVTTTKSTPQNPAKPQKNHEYNKTSLQWRTHDPKKHRKNQHKKLKPDLFCYGTSSRNKTQIYRRYKATKIPQKP